MRYPYCTFGQWSVHPVAVSLMFFFFLEGFLVWRWIKSCATNCAAYYVTTIPAHCQLKDGDKTSCIEGLSNIRLAWVIEINIDQP